MKKNEKWEVRILKSPGEWSQRKGVPGTQGLVLRRRMAGKACGVW